MTQFKDVNPAEAKAAEEKARAAGTTTTDQYKALLQAVQHADKLQEILNTSRKKDSKRDVKAAKAWAEFNQIVEDNKSGRRGYSRTQMGFEDSMYELAVSCQAMGRALAYTTLGSVIAGALDFTEEDKQKWEIRSAKTAQFGAKALRCVGGGVLALAGILITGPEALYRLNSSDPNLFQKLMGIKTDIPRVDYRVIFDSTGTASRQLIVQDSADISADQMKQHEAYFDNEFLGWLDLEHGYEFRPPNAALPDCPRGAFFNRDTGIKLNAAEYNRLNSIPGKSLSEFIEHRTKIHVTELNALPEEKPRPRL